MDPRFPPLKAQRQIDPRFAARSKALALPDGLNLPWGEWLLATVLLLCLLAV